MIPGPYIVDLEKMVQYKIDDKWGSQALTRGLNNLRTRPLSQQLLFEDTQFDCP